jgi:hypothetical protein
VADTKSSDKSGKTDPKAAASKITKDTTKKTEEELSKEDLDKVTGGIIFVGGKLT